ncbi:MAG: hypothetical protein IJ802_00130 [Kiritimatiellae bacterium]|nr:hypothetical protein [Kiritimatiellia bacterium]
MNEFDKNGIHRSVWKDALRLVREAHALPFGSAEEIKARARAFDFLRKRPEKFFASLAHLLQPNASERSIEAALAPLERMDSKLRITDVDIVIRDTDAAEKPAAAPIAVVADNIRSALNMGGIFRTAEFFGAEKIVLCGYTPGPENAQVQKTALGADGFIPSERGGDIREAIPRLKAAGYAIYALETAQNATDIASLQPHLPCALLLGNERFGLDADVLEMADETIVIPSHGRKNSLNVVSALAAALAVVRTKIP